MFRQNSSGMTCENYWKELTIVFKYLIITTLSIGILGIFTNIFTYMFANIIVLTVNRFQLWRLLTSFLVDRSIINIFFNLYILSMYIPQLVNIN